MKTALYTFKTGSKTLREFFRKLYQEKVVDLGLLKGERIGDEVEVSVCVFSNKKKEVYSPTALVEVVVYKPLEKVQKIVGKQEYLQDFKISQSLALNLTILRYRHLLKPERIYGFKTGVVN